jgi:hypothetical protein
MESLREPLDVWIPNWYQIYGSNPVVKFTIFAMLLSPFVLLGLFLIKPNRYKENLCFIGLLVVGIVLWFFNAPDPRFAQGLLVFFVAYILASLSYLISYFKIFNVLKFFLVLMILSISFKFYLLNPSFKFSPEKIPEVKTIVYPVSNGNIHIPDESREQCWESELPCAPYRNSRISYRGSSLADGFKIK